MEHVSLDEVHAADRLTIGPAGVVVGDPMLVDLSEVDWADSTRVAAAGSRLSAHAGVAIGVSDVVLPDEAAPVLDGLAFTLAPGGPGRGWVETRNRGHDTIAAVEATLRAAPRAALVLVETLRATTRASVPDGLLLESLAYSMLLASPEFTRWRAATPRADAVEDADAVLVDRSPHGILTVTLNRPQRHNAFGRAIRDHVLDALNLATVDLTIEQVVLQGNGPSFCSGGDLDEFGTSPDPVTSHLVRLDASAGWAVHRIRDRVRAVLHGACIGAGIEVPAFASRVEARADAWFQLPELSMGLIPGAGGTVSITRRIGRWRTAWMALTGQRVDVATALSWGLVDGRA